MVDLALLRSQRHGRLKIGHVDRLDLIVGRWAHVDELADGARLAVLLHERDKLVAVVGNERVALGAILARRQLAHVVERVLDESLLLHEVRLVEQVGDRELTDDASLSFDRRTAALCSFM